MPSPRQRAVALCEQAKDKHLAGDVEDALQLYTESIDAFPTAEAYTFRGWAHSFQGRLDDAIADCKAAIALDPDFGNPYNDIGSYLMKQDKHDEAIEWLERAKLAPRYEPRHYPYVNLGRIFAARGHLLRAIDEIRGALLYRPDDEDCLRALEALRHKVQ